MKRFINVSCPKNVILIACYMHCSFLGRRTAFRTAFGLQSCAKNGAGKMIGDRIKTLRGEEPQELFGARFGVSRNTIGRYESGTNPPDTEFVLKLCQEYKINAHWLITGAGEKGIDLEPADSHKQTDNPINIDAKAVSNCTHKIEDLYCVPRVKAKLSAGNGSFLTDSEVTCEYAFRREWIYTKGQPDKMVILFVSGTSMQPEIYDNDMVMIDQSQTDIHSGKIYAVGVEDTILIKYVDVEPGQLILRSKNPEYSPIIIERAQQDQIRILGRVIWTAREY